eukprot:CAMPEP_0194030314 /NCGR_PEP_ID=MMETSP0009_2-20130614/3856_1 /TAXON_ID=210454 /ORGANISM="Grammatophora oceanica, Strain CCMP 410" /LENGTH=199 /DNA_ID=CAMNT_0038670249 /DNA_START=62 /DNA_END=661 /DNA_ORIENTATION=-
MGNSASASNLPALQTTAVSTADMMGTWFVIAVKPTIFEKTCSNAVEKYSLMWDSDDDKKKTSSKFDINIDFQYNSDEPIESKLKALPQKGWVQGEDKTVSGDWKVSPLYPIKMPFLILEADKNCKDYTVIGYPSRDYCWIMSRKPVMKESTYNMLTEKLTKEHQYDLEGLRKVPQKWTKEEREKRGLTVEEVPNSVLTT